MSCIPCNSMRRSLDVREAVRCFVPLNILLSHSRSLKMVPFESLSMVSYSHSIATMAVRLPVSTQYTNVTDRDSQIDTARRAVGHATLMHCIRGGAPIGAGGVMTPPLFEAKGDGGHNLGIIHISYCYYHAFTLTSTLCRLFWRVGHHAVAAVNYFPIGGL